jgi:hypothetical protein
MKSPRLDRGLFYSIIFLIKISQHVYDNIISQHSQRTILRRAHILLVPKPKILPVDFPET